MIDVEKIDDELYKSAYGLQKVGNYNEIWSRIKNHPEILKEAVQIKRDRFNERDVVKGLAIANTMLIDYENVDNVAYNSLINSIYSNVDVARIVINGASNGGYSFLLMSLWNHNLKLTEEQKSFAVNEAMNKIGTTRWYQREKMFSSRLDNMGISDDNTTFVEIDNSINPIGQKSKFEHVNYMFANLSNEQAHGTGDFDIRYYILRNPNWSLEEKQKLIMDFWYDDEIYDECLEQWEWNIVNGCINYEDNSVLIFDKDQLYQISYDEVLSFYGNTEMANKVWNEIQFCKQMHELRPQQFELQFILKKSNTNK